MPLDVRPVFMSEQDAKDHTLWHSWNRAKPDPLNVVREAYHDWLCHPKEQEIDLFVRILKGLGYYA